MNVNTFTFNPNKCIACSACVVGCAIQNESRQSKTWRNVYTFNELQTPKLPVFHISMACNHCNDAPCLNFCPANAYSRDQLTGAVEIDQNRCIGCGYCTWNCPYDVPKMNQGQGIIEKCDWCNEKLYLGENPACVSACVTGALSYNEIEESLISNDNDYNTSPRLNIIGKKTSPLKTFIDPVAVPSKKAPVREKKITARKEWPLVIFTILFPVIGAKYLFDIINFEVNIWIHITSLFVASLLSLMHLGKPFRAWRAILNLKKSWLSREILFFGLFSILSTISIVYTNKYLIFCSLFTLIGGLISVDRVYYKYLNHDKFHSASAILVFLTVYSYCFSIQYLLPITLVLGLFLYFKRKIVMFKNKTLSVISYLRIIIGYLTPVLLLFTGDYTSTLIAVLVGYGIVIDRIEFYNEIEVNSPYINFKNKEDRLLDEID
jgi:Fe-S-cluster-containing dehydrogenase component